MERRTLGGREVDDVAVGLEHVDLLDSLDGLSVQLLQSGLQLLVVIGAASDIPSLLLSGGTLAACNDDRKPVNRSIFFLKQFEGRLTRTHSRWFWTGPRARNRTNGLTTYQYGPGQHRQTSSSGSPARQPCLRLVFRGRASCNFWRALRGCGEGSSGSEGSSSRGEKKKNWEDLNSRAICQLLGQWQKVQTEPLEVRKQLGSLVTHLLIIQ